MDKDTGERAIQFHSEVQTEHFATKQGPQCSVSQPQLKVVYIFAGHRRRADVREHLEELAKIHGFTLNLHEVDLVRGKDHDVLDETVWTNLVAFIRDFAPFCMWLRPHVQLAVGLGICTSVFLDLVPYAPEITPWVFHG